MRSNDGQQKRAAYWVSVMLLILFAIGISLDGFASPAPVYAETGDKTIKAGKVTMDVSHANLGYVMVKHSGSSKKLKVQVSGDGVLQTYDLNGENRYEVFPLTQGSASYKISVLENVKGTSYSLLTSKTVKVKMSDENAAFLCPNQLAWYTADSKAVAKSMELCAALDNDWEKAQAIYEFVTKQIHYDHMKAITVRNPYFPDVDATLETNMGICFDYAALFACMMRVQGIPTMLVIGDLLPTSQRHAWNKFYVDGTWTMVDATFGSNGYKSSDYAEDRFN